MPFAQGGSAIITLVMPPPGGDGYGALQAGGALAQGASAIYHNPALLADLERSTGSQLSYSFSRQNLLPVLRLPDLKQTFRSIAAVAPDPESGTDMAIGFFHNKVTFGENTQTDGNGRIIRRFNSYEEVHGLGTAIRLGVPISLGATAKFFSSHLADGIKSGFVEALPAYGWAFDVGILMNPRLSPALELGWPALVFTPSFALTVRNLGPDIFYTEALQSDPIPTTYSAAYGVKLEAFDYAEFEAGADMDCEWTHRSVDWNQVRILGYSICMAGLRYSAGWLDDPSGKRYERHSAASLEINFLRWHRLLGRFKQSDFASPSRAFDSGFPFVKAEFLGIPFRANPRFEIGMRKIRGGGIRGGQESQGYFSLSL